MRYNYASLNQVQKNSISRQINRLKKEKDKKGNVKYPEISNMASESVTKFLNKFSVVKLKYEGDDDQSKLELLDKQIDDFMADANITTNFFKTLRNGWYYMVVRSSEEQNKKITKRDFVAHTFTAMTFAQLNINDFYDKCDIDFPSRSYIDSETGKIEDIFLTNFEVRPAIIDLFSIYRAENPEKKRTQSLVGFVTEKTTEIADVFKISADNEIDKDLSKYLAWIIVTQNNRFEGIKEVSNYED